MSIKSEDYHDYFIKDGKFIGAFEQMYQKVNDPWHHGEATAIQYDLALYLIDRWNICSQGGSVLDIGCGKGAFTARLKKQMTAAKILAVDVAPTAIKKAKEKYGQMGIDFRTMDIRKEHKNINGEFDLIVISQLMWCVLPEFHTIVNYLCENSLKNGGHLLINQAFYKPDVQKYGKEIVSTIEDMLSLIKLEVLEMIETNRLTNHDAIVLFKKS